jgi:hypothetical protein
MSFRNYTPAAWQGNNNDVWDGRFDDGLGPTQNTFRDEQGRRCRVVCEPPRNNQDPRRIARIILGKPIGQARRIYPNIRVVIRDGQQLMMTQDFQEDRINVEIRNGIIVRIVGFY